MIQIVDLFVRKRPVYYHVEVDVSGTRPIVWKGYGPEQVGTNYISAENA